MVIRFIKHFVLKGISFLQRNGIDVINESLTPRQRQIERLEVDLYNLKAGMVAYTDKFILEIGDTYISLLAKADDKQKTIMMQHWIESLDKFNDQYTKYYQLLTEINKIRSLKNPIQNGY